jgi:hypothetical protein
MGRDRLHEIVHQMGYKRFTKTKKKIEKFPKRYDLIWLVDTKKKVVLEDKQKCVKKQKQRAALETPITALNEPVFQYTDFAILVVVSFILSIILCCCYQA